MRLPLECANCGRHFDRGGFTVPPDLADRGVYVVVESCAKCRGRDP